MIADVKAKDLFSWATLEFDFERGVTAVRGFNHDDGTPEGSGKSSIPNIVCWTLFGEIPKDVKIDEVIREGAESGFGDVGLLDGTRVVRSRKPNDLYMVDARGTKIKGKDAKETQSKINAKLGMGFDTFCQAIYFSQNYPNKFISVNEKKKGEILSEVQDLDQFTQARKDAAKLLSLEEDVASRLSYSISAEETQLEWLNTQIRDCMESIQLFQIEKEKKLATLNAQRAGLVQELGELELLLDPEAVESMPEIAKEVASEISRVEGLILELKTQMAAKKRNAEDRAFWTNKATETQLRIKDQEAVQKLLREQLNSIPESNQEKTELQADVEALMLHRGELQTQVRTLELQNMARKRLKMDLAEKAEITHSSYVLMMAFTESDAQECPTCGGELGAKHRAEHAERLTKIFESAKAASDKVQKELDGMPAVAAEALQDELIQVEQAIKQAKNSLDIISRNEAKAQKLTRDLDISVSANEKLVEDMTAIEQKINSLPPPSVEDCAQILSDFGGVLQNLKKDQESLQKLALEQASFQKHQTNLHKQLAQLDLTMAETEKEAPTFVAHKLDQFREKLQVGEEQVTSMRTLLSEKTLHMGRLRTLKDGFGEVKSYVFRGLLQELSKKANKYLADLFEVPISIKFSNAGDEGEISKISTDVTLDGNKRPLGLYSGGQFRRIQIAVDLALSDIVSARAGKPMNLRIFDEPFKDLSETSMEKALRLFESFKGSTVLIEHNSMINSIVNKTFEVELINGVSRRVE